MSVIQEIRKAALTTEDFTDFGIKTPKQWNNFIHKLREQPNIFKFARVEALPTKEDKIPKIGFKGRLLTPAREDTTFLDANQKKPYLEEVTITVQKMWGEIAVSYETLEDNIRGTNIKQDIQQIITEKTAEDLADLFWNGDTTSSDIFLAQTDGFLKRAISNEYDFNNNVVSKEMLANTYRALPNVYKKNRSKLRYIMHSAPVFDYQETLTNLQTPMGDRAKVEEYLPKAMGIAFEEAPLIASYINGIEENSKALLTFPKNLIIGFRRQVNITMVDEPRNERLVFHVSLRAGLNFEEEDAVVLMNNIQHKSAA